MFEENNYSRIPVIDDPFLKEKNAPYYLELTLEQITDLLFILECYRRETLDYFNASSVENQRRCYDAYDNLISKSSNLISFFESKLSSSHIYLLMAKKDNLERVKTNLSWRYKDNFNNHTLDHLYDLKEKSLKNKN